MNTQKENKVELIVLDGQISLDDVLDGRVDVDDGELGNFNATYKSEVE